MRGKPEVSKHTYSTYRQPATEHIVIAVPALVDAELFAAVQERLEENRRRLRVQQRGARYLLQGLAVCGCCGYAIIGLGKGPGQPAYYRCHGTNGYRFGGQPVCRNRTQRVEDLDAAVWNDVCDLLKEPDRLCQEFERRRQRAGAGQATAEEESLRKALAKVQQSMSRLLDAYTEGYVDRSEFPRRMERLQERRSKLQADLSLVQQQAKRDEDFQVVFSHVQAFADLVKAGLTTADWLTRREILRALVKRVEVGRDTIDIVYKVPSRPFAKAPNGGPLQHCWSSLGLSMLRPRLHIST